MELNTTITLGANIREARLERRITLRAFAKVLNVSATQLSMIEQDRTIPAAEFLELIASELGLDPNVLCAMAGKLTPKAEEKLTRLARTDPIYFRSMIERIGGAK